MNAIVTVVGSYQSGLRLPNNTRLDYREGLHDGLRPVYALRTHAHTGLAMALDEICEGVKRLKSFAIENPHLQFQVHEIACGDKMYDPEDIAPMFRGAPSNIMLPDSFASILTAFPDRSRRPGA